MHVEGAEHARWRTYARNIIGTTWEAVSRCGGYIALDALHQRTVPEGLELWLKERYYHTLYGHADTV
jgi:hypothetical protein